MAASLLTGQPSVACRRGPSCQSVAGGGSWLPGLARTLHADCLVSNLWCRGYQPSTVVRAPDCWVACMQTMFCYIPCRFIPHPAGCASNRVHPDIFNATKHNGPGGTGHESGGASDLFTDSLAIRALICWPTGELSSVHRFYSWLVICATSPRKKRS